MCLVLAVVGLLAVMAVGWRQLRPRAGHALPALALGGRRHRASLLAYPTWYGLAGPQAVTGMLFALAPISGVPLSGLLAPGPYAARAGALRPLRRVPGPQRARRPTTSAGAWRSPRSERSSSLAAVRSPGCSCSWRRVTFWLALGGYLLGAPAWLGPPVAALARAVDAAGPQGDPARPVRAAAHAVPGLPDRGRPRRAARRAPAARLVDRRRTGRRSPRSPRRRSPWSRWCPSFVTFDAPFACGAGAHPAVPAARWRPMLPGGHRGAHRPLRRLGLGAAHAVAGRRRHALPPGRRGAQDARRRWGARSDRGPRGRPGGS